MHPDAVEDVVQDILATVHQVRHTYAPERPFGPWLVSIASRRSIPTMKPCRDLERILWKTRQMRGCCATRLPSCPPASATRSRC
ncbi:sigma factor [Burkholderia ubonensis]|uniref:sigma factor n=1 Tax=Burkholderia ubonensis TaxID=101571 RepID=UPI001E4C4A61|nr:sigma factor [Burkholderia ubonensis]